MLQVHLWQEWRNPWNPPNPTAPIEGRINRFLLDFYIKDLKWQINSSKLSAKLWAPQTNIFIEIHLRSISVDKTA